MLEIARDHSWNEISGNCVFILSKIDKDGNAVEDRVKKKKIPKEFNEMMKELISIYSDLYDVILYVYKSRREVTIIEI